MVGAVAVMVSCVPASVTRPPHALVDGCRQIAQYELQARRAHASSHESSVRSAARHVHWALVGDGPGDADPQRRGEHLAT